jgi:hypothetical protein
VRVFFDIITIRFLLRYMSRPLHFFGPPGFLGLATGAAILFFLFVEKVFLRMDIILQHGPLLVLATMLFLFGVQVLAVGLLGELLMRTHFDANRRPTYRLERITRNSRVSHASASR